MFPKWLIYLLFPWLLLFGWGCRSASDEAGFSNPLAVYKESLFGREVSIGTSADGKFNVTYNPETKQITASGEFTSDPVPVIGAEAARVTAEFIQFSDRYYTSIERQQALVGQNISMVIGSLESLLAQGITGPAADTIKAALPILYNAKVGLGGQGLSVDFGGPAIGPSPP